MLFRRIALPVHVRHVADGLQCIERDTHREHHSGHGKLGPQHTEENIDVLCHKIVVVDVKQNAKQNKDSQAEYFYPLLLKVLFYFTLLFAVRTFLLLKRALRSDLIHPEGDLPGKEGSRHEKQHKEATK